MVTILDNIIKNKIIEVNRCKSEVGVTELHNLMRNLPAPRKLAIRLNRKNSVSIIAEIKRSSPSAGTIRWDFGPVSIAKIYEENGAHALSVVTDEKYFDGNINHLNLVRSQVNLPILRKDFIIEPYQVIQSRAYGADAILLILGVLDKGQCNEIVDAAKEYKLDLLVEVHTTDELDRALNCGFKLIGINNRNLKTFKADLKTTENLVSSIPKKLTVVSESGIKNKGDIKKLGKLGVDAVLIGEALMREPDIGVALQKLTGASKWSR